MTTFCSREQCTGHLGKFVSCLAEALHMMSLDINDGVTGDVTNGAAHALMVIVEPMDFDISHAQDGSDAVHIDPGSYIVTTMESGAVHLFEFESEDDARAEYDRRDAAEHVDYPHAHGYMLDCVACEAKCHCEDGSCVYCRAESGSDDE